MKRATALVLIMLAMTEQLALADESSSVDTAYVQVDAPPEAELRDDDDPFQDGCAAPCERPMRADHSYRVVWGQQRSDAFKLPAPRDGQVSLSVSRRGQAEKTWGVVSIVTGGVLLMGDTMALSLAGSAQGAEVAAVVGCFVAGAALLTTGIFLVISGRHKKGLEVSF